MQKITLVLFGFLIGGCFSQALAQPYPNKTIRIIELAGPGSAVDVFARKPAPGLAERLGHSVVVENKKGQGAGSVPGVLSL